MKITPENFPFGRRPDIAPEWQKKSDELHRELDRIAYEGRCTILYLFYSGAEARSRILREGYDQYVRTLPIFSENCLRAVRPYSAPEYQAIVMHQSSALSAMIDDLFCALSVDPTVVVDLLMFSTSDCRSDPFDHYQNGFNERRCGQPVFIDAFHIVDGKVSLRASGKTHRSPTDEFQLA